MVCFWLGRYCTNQLISLSEFPVIYEQSKRMWNVVTSLLISGSGSSRKKSLSVLEWKIKAIFHSTKSVIPKVCSTDLWLSARLAQVFRQSLNKSILCASRTKNSLNASHTKKVWEPLYWTKLHNRTTSFNQCYCCKLLTVIGFCSFQSIRVTAESFSLMITLPRLDLYIA
jgi:hypothetical protein